MLVKSISALAVLAFAAQAIAEPKPYKPMLMKSSVRDLFGVVRRQDTPGYQPSQAVCGTGATCEAACGAGYQTCASTDDSVHCYNPSINEICCPDQSGSACDAGYYCTSDKVGETWCCPNAMDTTACAAAYSVAGGLVSQTAKPSSTSSIPPHITPVKNATVASVESSDASTSCTSTIVPSAGFPGSNATVPTFGSAPAPGPTHTSSIQQGAGQMLAPAGSLVLLAAGIAVLL